jgi:hypothetical protein
MKTLFNQSPIKSKDTIYVIVDNKSQVILRLTIVISFNWDLKKSQLECTDQMIQYWNIQEGVSNWRFKRNILKKMGDKYLFNSIILYMYAIF